MPSSAVQVFNQYYWDLLKKVKDLAKDLKYRNDDLGARDVLREIKKSYMTFDKGSEEHIDWYRSHATAFDTYVAAHIQKDAAASSIVDWSRDEEVAKVELYKGITIGAISRLFRNQNVILYYLILLCIFAQKELGQEELDHTIEVLKKEQPWNSESMEAEGLGSTTKLCLYALRDIHASSAAASSTNAPSGNPDDVMSQLENTSLGRLAKEIMNDVDVDEISKSIGEDGDIMKALTNPEGGITKLIGTVSQKMISKLASGELKQDTLMQDAMKLAGVLPNMPGGGKAMGGLGNMANMMESMTKMASMFGGGGEDGDDEAPDMASMISQFTKMMGGGAAPKAPKGARTTVNSAALNRSVRAKQLRRKLEEKRKQHEQS